MRHEQGKPDAEAERKEIRIILRLMRDNGERGLRESEEYQYWKKVNSLNEKLELLTRVPETALERAALSLLTCMIAGNGLTGRGKRCGCAPCSGKSAAMSAQGHCVVKVNPGHKIPFCVPGVSQYPDKRRRVRTM